MIAVEVDPGACASTTHLFATEGVEGAALPAAISALGAALEREFVRVRLRPGVSDAPADFLVGSFQRRELDGLRIAHFRGSPLTGVRTAADIRHAPRDDFLVTVPVTSTVRISQDGRRAVLEPGDLAVLDSSRPYVMEMGGQDRFDHVLIRVPRLRFRLDDHAAAVTAVRVPADGGAGRVLAPFFSTIVSPGWTADTLTSRFVNSGLDLLAAALQERAGSTVPTSPLAEVLAACQREARQHLTDPDLSPTQVAAACAISVRQLHRAFSTHGRAFGSWVRDERLAASYRDLLDAQLRHLRISDIAVRWGYRSAAHFSRDFRNRYGLCPSDVRHGVRRTQPPQPPVP
jgi:AraC-like DNA-binding protein